MKDTDTSLQTGKDSQRLRMMSERNHGGKCVMILGDFEEMKEQLPLCCISMGTSSCHITCIKINSLRAPV